MFGRFFSGKPPSRSKRLMEVSYEIIRLSRRATGEPWEIKDGFSLVGGINWGNHGGSYRTIHTFVNTGMDKADNEYMAAIHPGVAMQFAFILADLAQVAEHHEDFIDNSNSGLGLYIDSMICRGEKVAKLILDKTSEFGE